MIDPEGGWESGAGTRDSGAVYGPQRRDRQQPVRRHCPGPPGTLPNVTTVTVAIDGSPLLGPYSLNWQLPVGVILLAVVLLAPRGIAGAFAKKTQ